MGKIDLYTVQQEKELLLPMAEESIRAGFPSPAQDYMELSIDLNRELIAHPSSTFLGRVTGDSMVEAGVEAGDILVIDKSLDPQNGDMAVCSIDGEFTLKFIHIQQGVVWLMPANKNYAPIAIEQENDFRVWGVVTYTIKKRRGK
ncbi:MAG: translesion error-prone DNA polymerase V autoproteolytic subunit [Bacteroidaceae bacterium]|nr:translesion error-prone DNA polymerase V autoproteolytic subunit [Bacteroidaceae bacterium]